MGQLIVRNLDDRVGGATRAGAVHRTRAADIAEARARADRLRRDPEGQLHSDSAALIREDRDP